MHSGWDQHSNLFTQLEEQCRDTEGPSAALVRDLKERGMLDDTLIVWGENSVGPPLARVNPKVPWVVTILGGPTAGGWLVVG